MTSLLSQFSSMATRVDSGENDTSADVNISKTRTEKTQARYAEAFANGNTVAKACVLLKIGHVACLNQVYRYERKGLMSRGTRSLETGGIYFYWQNGNK